LAAILRAGVAAARWAFAARCRTASNRACVSARGRPDLSPGIARELRKQVAILEREIAELEQV